MDEPGVATSALRDQLRGITGLHDATQVHDHDAPAPHAADDVEVVGTIRWRSPRENITGFADRVQLVDSDLRDQAGVRRLLEQVRPDAIFHLAGVAFVPAAQMDPGAALEVNVIAAAFAEEVIVPLEIDQA